LVNIKKITVMKRARRYYAFLVIASILLFGISANTPDVYGVKAQSIGVKITTTGGLPIVIDPTDKGAVSHNIDPSDGGTPNNDGLTVIASGTVFTVTPGPGTAKVGDGTLDTETRFKIDGVEIRALQIHTSCSKDISPGAPDATTTDGTITLMVVGFNGNDGRDPCDPLVGGTGFAIDKTALLLATAQTNALWLIPVIVSAIGIGIVIARKF